MKAIKKKLMEPILEIGEDFAELSSFSNDVSNYIFKYNFDASSALNLGLINIKIKVYKEKPKNQLGIFSDAENSEQVVDKILLNSSNDKNTKNYNSTLIIANKNSDPTSKINNNSIVNGVIDQNKIVNTKVFSSMETLELNKTNTIVPILQFSNFVSVKKNKTIPTANVYAILKQNKDPIDDISINVVNSYSKSFSGISNIVKNTNSEILSSLINNQQSVGSSNTLNNSSTVPVVSNSRELTSIVLTNIKIKQSDLTDRDAFYVSFELTDSKGIVHQRIINSVTHSKNLKTLQTPVISPDVVISKQKIPGKNILYVRQKDQNANRVRVYRKELKSGINLNDTTYDLVGDFNLQPREKFSAIVDKTGNDSNIVYKVVSVGNQGQISAEFTNVVAPGLNIGKSFRDNEFSSASVIAILSEQGIQTEVVGIPPGVIAVKILKRDLTIFEKTFAEITHVSTNQKVFLTNGINRTGYFLDKSVKDGHVYEYCAKLIYQNGCERLADGCDYIEYVNFDYSEQTVAFDVSKPKIVARTNSLDVVFNINSTVLDGYLDNLKTLLSRQGLLDYFKDDLTNEKDSFKKLLAFSVRRIDMMTGEDVYYKPFTSKTFSDLDNQGTKNVSLLKPGHSYKYIITPLLRSPETLFEDNTKTSTNKGGVSHSYLPMKYFHPSVQKTGAIVSKNVLKLNHSKTEFEFGAIGKSYQTEITLDNVFPKLSNARATKISSNRVVVRWQVLGDKGLIEHFIIILNRLGQEEIVGKAHAIFDSDIIEFIDILDKGEVGSLKYKIVPVLKNYQYAPSIITNEVII